MTLYIRLEALSPEVRARVLSTVDTVSSRDVEDSYLSMLNDCYDTVSICGHEYSAGDALAAVDPVAFRCGFADFVGSDEDSVVEYSGTYYESRSLEAALDDYDEAEAAKADALAEAAEAEANHPNDEGND
jgi:hypothetical protein